MTFGLANRLYSITGASKLTRKLGRFTYGAIFAADTTFSYVAVTPSQ
jgi:hypothetical protein